MTRDEYITRLVANMWYTGSSFVDAISHSPCPFCGAPDFMIYRVLEVREAISIGGICKECGRGARGEWKTATRFELVQTVGDDPPDYLPPIRRVLSDA